MTFPITVRSPLTVWLLVIVSAENVGLLAVVSHPLKLTAFAVAAVVAVVAFHEIPIPHVPEAHHPTLVGASLAT